MNADKIAHLNITHTHPNDTTNVRAVVTLLIFVLNFHHMCTRGQCSCSNGGCLILRQSNNAAFFHCIPTAPVQCALRSRFFFLTKWR